MATERFIKIRPPLRLLEPPSTLHASPGVRKQEARIKKRAVLNLRDIFLPYLPWYCGYNDHDDLYIMVYIYLFIMYIASATVAVVMYY